MPATKEIKLSVIREFLDNFIDRATPKKLVDLYNHLADKVIADSAIDYDN